MFTAEQINALQSCIEVADPGEDRDDFQFITIENALSAVKRMREEHRQVANNTLQGLALFLEKQGIWLARNVTIQLDPSNVQDEERRQDALTVFQQFLKDTYPFPKPLPDFEEDDDRALAEVEEIGYILTAAGIPKRDGMKWLSPVERTQELLRLYRGLKNTLDQALNSGDGTYKP